MFDEELMVRHMNNTHMTQITKQLCHTSTLSRQEYVIAMLNGYPTRLFDTIRINRNMMYALCNHLRTMNVLQDNKIISVDEFVVMF